MSRACRLDKTNPVRYQWITDDKPCEGLDLGPHESIVVEVGNLPSGAVVDLRGGLLGDSDVLLASIKKPELRVLPPIRYLRPDTDAIGVRITFMGVN